MSPNEQRLNELAAIRHRFLTPDELAEAAKLATYSKWNAKRRARYWADEDFRRNEAERKKQYRNRGYR